MKIILKQDVKNVGKKDEVVNVSDGYANNFLIPKGLGITATAGSLNVVKNKQKAAADKKKRELDEANALAAVLKEKTVVIRMKCGENGKLFGAVSSKEIADELKKQHGQDLDKKKLVLHETIKTLGTYEIEAKLCPGVSAHFKVKVESV